jgi:hypothetical protein
VPVPVDGATVEVPVTAFAAFEVAVGTVVPVAVTFVAVPIAVLTTNVAVTPGLIWPFKIS